MQKPIKSKNLFCGISMLYVSILFVCDIINLVLSLVRGAIHSEVGYFFYNILITLGLNNPSMVNSLILSIILLPIHLVLLILNIVSIIKMNEKAAKTISLVTVIASASLSLLLILINTISYLITLSRYISLGGTFQFSTVFIQFIVLGFKVLFNIAFIVAILIAIKKAPQLITDNANNTIDGVKDFKTPTVDPIYTDMVTHTLLCIFTLGIYQYFWVYKTTKFLNRVVPLNNRNEVLELILYIFIPFYSVYWYYCTAKSYNILTQTDNTTLFIILDLLGGNLAAPVLIQYKFNEIAQAQFEQEIKEYQQTNVKTSKEKEEKEVNNVNYTTDYTDIYGIDITNSSENVSSNFDIISNENLEYSAIADKTDSILNNEQNSSVEIECIEEVNNTKNN